MAGWARCIPRYTAAATEHSQRPTYIPETDGTERPLGVASLEDRIIQHAVCRHQHLVTKHFSFRPGRPLASTLI
jgi:hypothetical protein